MAEPARLDASTPTHAAVHAMARKLDRPIVLVGLMGVGKTTVGRRLAAALGYRFVDADEAIEVAAQMAVPDIFATYGEQYFRDGERRVIARLMDEARSTKTVIATGGGAFVDPETRALILDRGIAVWLDSDVETLTERVGRKSNRPLLQGGEPREILSRLLAERSPAYAQAPIRVESRAGPHQRTVSAILRELAQWR